MATNSYILARISDPVKLIAAAASLKSIDSVLHWDAVEGHVQIVVKINSPASNIPDSIKKIGSLIEIFAYDIIQDGREKNFAPDKVYTYLFIETESAKIDSVKSALEKLSSVYSVEKISGGCDLVAIIEGDSFQSTENLIREKISVLEGILRIKKDRVINLLNI
jgi:hypothetical protein